eukprot:NODE_289_length_10645_cov_0.615115.p2 type:complete len:449 gc:universal NODE_289_length_10645_cov_0.615115:2157-3503(+)
MSIPKLIKSDLELNPHTKLDAAKIGKDILLTQWEMSFFKAQFPTSFAKFKMNLSEYPGYYEYFEYYSIVYLKTFKSSVHMKILHPRAFLDVSEAIYNNIFENTPTVLVDGWKHENVHCTSSDIFVLELRKELALDGYYGSRFDIIRFYHSFYLHVITWIKKKSKKLENIEFDKGLKNWSTKLDRAVEFVQWKQSREFPIESSMIDELAEAMLICLDDIACERVTNAGESKDNFNVVRFKDNYEIYADSKTTCKLVEETYVELLREMELDVQFEDDWTCRKMSNEQSKDPINLIRSSNLTTGYDLLKNSVHSMDYAHVLRSYVERALSQNNRDRLKQLLKLHPQSVKPILSKIESSLLINTISDCLLDSIDLYLFGGITCQFLCILDFVLKHKALIWETWRNHLKIQQILKKYEKDPFIKVYVKCLEGNGNGLDLNMTLQEFIEFLERP